MICGGGQTGHLAVALFSQYLNIKTSLLTQNATTVERHQQQNNILSVHYNNGEIINHSVGLITNSPQLVIPEADIVILTVPSHHQASVGYVLFLLIYLLLKLFLSVLFLN
ncbi:hypothetical protein AB6F62_07975 [Providencia huaxiensis]|uniref:hypothetical protein n=1 Tax=Providencia huaxiensis TaxID=2027290 RepID=UPI0034DD8FBF